MTPTPAEKLVDETIAAQRAKGRAKYGKGLDHADGHDWPMEALQEAIDGMQYLAAEVVRLRARPSPVTARLRAALAEFVAAVDEEQAAWSRYELSGARDNVAWPHAAIDKLRVAEKRLAKFATNDLPAILDAVDAGPTFLEAHAAPMAAQAARTATERRLRGELAAGRKLVRELIDGGCIDPAGDSALVHRVVAFAEGE